ncbi:MAG TPA: 50S ribosomal protein L5 [Pirellulaceae bacterium]|jgi:large subunit ribosomal protein L5|nr:50S ribosomal protein L5 [Pirellulaceae bacterium]
MKPRLQERYENEIREELRKKFNYTNVHQIPRLEKIVINMGVGSGITEKKHVEEAVESMSALAGQRAVTTRARKSIANFKLREGLAIGAMVTLRRDRMYEFLDRLINLALPRVRDFRGINEKAFDGNGNYSFGLTEQLVFPEVNPDKFLRPQGMNIVVVTTARTNDEAKFLLEQFGMPFRRKDKVA